MTPDQAELRREWAAKGLLHILRDAPAYMRNARLAAGKNDLALLAIVDPITNDVSWSWFTRIELLCAVIEKMPACPNTIQGLGEEQPDPAKFPVLVIEEGLMLAIIDMTEVKESVGLN